MEIEEETILDEIIVRLGHSPMTHIFAHNMFEELHLAMKERYNDLWEDRLKTICAVICYWMASNITEKNKMTSKDVNAILDSSFSDDDLQSLRLLIAKYLNYNLLDHL